MFKLGMVTLLALLIPILWVAAAKADTTTGYNHARAWSSSVDVSSLNSQQRTTQSLRDSITTGHVGITNLHHMMNSRSSYHETGRGLLTAADNIQASANQTSDNMELENYSQQIRSLQDAMSVLIQLER